MNDEAKALPVEVAIYAGFWKRFAAMVVDYYIVASLAFIFVFLAELFSPDKYKIESPFGLWTNEETVESNTSEETVSDGSTIKKEISVTKETHFGRWAYFYKTEKTTVGDDTESKKTELINGVETSEFRTTDSDYIFWLFLLYLCAFEASKLQATPGKMLFKAKVVNASGEKPTPLRAIARNVAKPLSMFIFFIGFLMVLWTKRKQTLHDYITSCCIINTNATTRAAEASANDSADSAVIATLWIFGFLFIALPLIGMLLAVVLPMVMGK